MTCRSMGGVYVMISRPLVGVCALTGPSGRRAALWMAVKSFILVCCCAQFAQRWQPYVSLGLTIPVYAHFIRPGCGPHVELMALLVRYRSDLAFLAFSLIWCVQFSFWFSVIPRYFVLVQYGMVTWLMCKCVIVGVFCLR